MRSLSIVWLQLFFSCVLLGQTYPINWTNLVGTTLTNNTLTKTSSNGWNAGAASTNVLAASTDGFVEVTVAQNDKHRFFGLSQKDEGIHYKDIDFALFLLSDQTVRIYESGSYKGAFGNYANGDKMRVERKGNGVLYKKNGTVIYTSTTTSTTTLIVDATIYHQGGTVENIIASFPADNTAPCADGDSDGDGICAGNDCDDTNPNLPGTPGASCDDGNAATTNDLIQADGCTCKGITPNNNSSSFWTDANSHIYRDGKVLIGPSSTTLPGNYNLYVTNGILAERVRVALTSDSWADYVFAPNYQLTDLSYVEAFIKANKHLPNVPSAAEVEKKGIDLGEMDATLLRQIEELWLHVIELKKEVTELRKENKELKEK